MKRKMIQKTLSVVSALLMLFSSVGTAPVALAEAPFACRQADDWNDLFDRRNQYIRGWLAADGIYTVATGADKTVFLFSDTLVGRSDKNGKTQDAWMPNHTAAVLKGTLPLRSGMTFYYGSEGKRQDGYNLFGGRYWLFDGVSIGDTLYILAFEPSDQMKPLCVRLVCVPVKHGEPQWARYTVGDSIPELCAPSADGRYIYAFGQGITDCTGEDGYVYIYGFRDPLVNGESRDLIVSRIKAEDFGDFSRLTYWDGDSWCGEIGQSAGVAENVGCEMSVTRLPSGPDAGKYILVYMYATMSGRLARQLADTPYGPFSDPVFFYDAPEHGQKAANGTDTLYTYNAKAHPALSPAGELLVSYNVNSSGEQYTTDYHPRFLYLTYDEEAKKTQNKTSFLFRLRAFFEKAVDFFLRFSPSH
ncbi:MAG: DUF4185 domain-containing protein [Clostridia bacterium]|nr:DUF4185 domain-containing protein [Clostridia bacterium]